MVTLTMEVGDHVEDALRQLAKHHGGDMGEVLTELLTLHESLDLMADDFEAGNEEYLKQQRDRS